jgi:hypothetical protein
MATRQINGIAELGGASPLQAANALAMSDGMPPELREMLIEELRDQMEARKRAKQKKENQAIANAQATMDEQKGRIAKQALCSHLKPDNKTTRLAGQFISGTGQLCLMCVHCYKEFFRPPNAALGQVDIPNHLMPQDDAIGG